MSKIRTSNPSDKKVISDLQSEGYEILKRGWPDLVAIKGDSIRFIEVKRRTTKFGSISKSKMKPDQIKMAEIFSKFGITVELIRGL